MAPRHGRFRGPRHRGRVPVEHGDLHRQSRPHRRNRPGGRSTHARRDHGTAFDVRLRGRLHWAARGRVCTRSRGREQRDWLGARVRPHRRRHADGPRIAAAECPQWGRSLPLARSPTNDHIEIPAKLTHSPCRVQDSGAVYWSGDFGRRPVSAVMAAVEASARCWLSPLGRKSATESCRVVATGTPRRTFQKVFGAEMAAPQGAAPVENPNSRYYSPVDK